MFQKYIFFNPCIGNLDVSIKNSIHNLKNIFAFNKI